MESFNAISAHKDHSTCCLYMPAGFGSGEIVVLNAKRKKKSTHIIMVNS